MSNIRRALVGVGMVAAFAGASTGTANAAATSERASVVAAVNYQAGPFSTLSKCNSTRLTYVRDGGFSYVGSCYRQTNGYYYFQYR